MPFHIVRNDITKMQVDAIVNAANRSLLGGGGVDGAIHEAAGPMLLKECEGLGGCETGKAKLTRGYNLPAKYVIHTVGPRWFGGRFGEEESLRSCYRTSLEIALKNEFESVAFPLISSGVYGYPIDQAFMIAKSEIQSFISKHDMTVYLVLFDRKSFQIGASLYASIQKYIDDRYAEEHFFARRLQSEFFPQAPRAARAAFEESPLETFEACAEDRHASHPLAYSKPSYNNIQDELSGILSRIDESFSQMLLRKIDESGMKDSECYKRANIDRKLFSKIRSDVHYKPSKPTAIAFAIALQMNLSETNELLSKAGFVLSQSSKFDLIIEYFIERKDYNIHSINEALFAFDQSLLGA